MEISAILLARAMALVESTDLNPTGAAYYPAVAEALVKRFNFQKFPEREEDFDETKGVVFQSGYFDNTTIEQFIVYRNGLVLDTRDSTVKSKSLLEGALKWTSENLGTTYKDGMIKRWQYESQVAFYSKASLTHMHPALQRLCNATSDFLAESTGDKLPYEAINLLLMHDPLLRKHPLGQFTIQRRDNIPFSESKYFSTAPLPTDLHIELLKEYESSLLTGK